MITALAIYLMQKADLGSKGAFGAILAIFLIIVALFQDFALINYLN